MLKGRNHGGCCRCDIRGQSNLFQFFKSGKFRVSSGAYCTHGNTPHTCTSSSGSAHENGSLSRFEGRKSPAVDDKSSSAHKDHTGSWDFLFGKHSSSSGINHRHSNSPS